ncbi:MAG: glutamyl-tRNA reductase [Lachnospirales bacterium]
MKILSISHKFVPLEIREQFALTEEKQKQFLLEATENKYIDECLYLTTCNRTEIYFHGNEKATSIIEKMIVNLVPENPNIKKYFLSYENNKAIKHLHNVTCGLESMIIGEDEILGQVKNAFNLALNLGTTKYLLNTLFKSAITCAKKIKTNTKISKIPLSIATLAANIVLEGKKELPSKVLIIGLTGQMGTKILKNLYEHNIYIVGTARQHNIILQYKSNYEKIKMIEYKDRYKYINESDYIISATKSPHYTLVKNEVEGYITTKKKRIFIDLSVPKDIDTEIANIHETKIYNIDFFKSIANKNNASRFKEVEYATIIIDEQIEEVLKELCFHNYIDKLDEIKNVFKTTKFENILYNIRDNSTSEELATILNSFSKLTK